MVKQALLVVMKIVCFAIIMAYVCVCAAKLVNTVFQEGNFGLLMFGVYVTTLGTRSALIFGEVNGHLGSSEVKL